jgi:hypothetical protein
MKSLSARNNNEKKEAPLNKVPGTINNAHSGSDMFS